ncbi:hypothetical protein Rxyl_3093 [Rubrobacter xylanophilus DSM 9941]|uniref:Lipoprotein n=1 Tax=Rubrobacter xylanophilus (strain DSM 9941 / JCM 11954 / NBRC 16129 / PRD-1) TaxID=266117 RepID=Q1ARH8_RUBXD|nr:hypothetical protein [Rubrobacter xylanophilus]ABG06000.1 hypothetical protein Rxyl_3093 [Rubrobacter xylanophilus DSM 9941]
MLRGRKEVLALFALLLAGLCLVAGCAGGGDEDRRQAGGDRQGKAAREERGGAQSRPELKIALGSIQAVNAEKERFTLKPSAEAQGEKPIPFKLAPGAGITLDGEEAQLSDMKPGQQAQVEYVVREDLAVPNRARVVELFSAGGG